MEDNKPFFTEALIDNNYVSKEEIERIVLDENKSDDQKCKELFDRSFEYVKYCDLGYYQPSDLIG